MAEEKLIETIEYFTNQLIRQGLKVSRIILFGSQVSGNATIESDIDLAVISEDFEGKTIFEKVKLLNQADARTIKKFLVPLDVILMSEKELESETSIIAGYVRQGKVVYYS